MDLHELLILLGDTEERLPGEDIRAALPLDPRTTAVLELAGRDSVAAALATETPTLLPTIVYTGTEYGDPSVLLHNLVLLRNRLGEERELLEPLVLGSPRWWAAVAGRFSSLLFRRYGHSFTCVGCHMYLHAVRVLLAARLGVGAVIAGERERHGPRVKVNQLPEALDAYAHVARSFGVELLMPLREVSGEEEMGRLVPGWGEGERQRRCVLSGNYLDEYGGFDPRDALPALRSYLDEFLVPLTFRLLGSFLGEGEELDPVREAADILESRG